MYTVEELRLAEQDDEIVLLGRHNAEDTDLTADFDEGILRASCLSMRRDVYRTNWNCFIAYKRDEPVGYILATCSPSLYSKRIVASLELFFVMPKLRGTRVTLMLVEAYERWALSNGASRLFTGTVNKRYAEKTSHMLEKLGYMRVGALHAKEIPIG